ncbi:hypothetical protein CDAR_220281 [Caerostris darwini]|uniref:Uncharacterized protein n=1 Tax=Caerostris darwini TaxID=1538125 RepID=A0AAV4UFH9_9ARAC|nr:hypothetical protein CDAR_220281 [Caerostris darwini]
MLCMAMDRNRIRELVLPISKAISLPPLSPFSTLDLQSISWSFIFRGNSPAISLLKYLCPCLWGGGPFSPLPCFFSRYYQGGRKLLVAASICCMLRKEFLRGFRRDVF